MYNYLSNPYWFFPVTHALARRYDAPPTLKKRWGSLLNERCLNFILRPKQRSQRHLLNRFQTIFFNGMPRRREPIVNGVKKRTPLLGGVNTKKRGGTGVDVSIRHSTPLPPSLGLGRGKGEIHRGSNYFVFCFFCDNMLFFRVRKKEKKTVATYPGHRWFF